MELKHGTFVWWEIADMLLIVPYGIETCLRNANAADSRLF